MNPTFRLRYIVIPFKPRHPFRDRVTRRATATPSRTLFNNMPCTIAMRIQYHPGPKWLSAASFNERDIRKEGIATLRKDLVTLGMGNLQPKSQNVVQSKMLGALEVFWNAVNEKVCNSCSLCTSLYHLGAAEHSRMF